MGSLGLGADGTVPEKKRALRAQLGLTHGMGLEALQTGAGDLQEEDEMEGDA
jgi:hypothetical protein